MRFVAVLLMVILLFEPGSSAQQQFCGVRNNVIDPGERVNFTVYYNLSAIWVAAGTASFTTSLSAVDGVPVYHIKGAGKTFSSYDWIYKVNDTYESFVDTLTLLPKKFVRDVNENGSKKYEYVRFVHAQNKAFANSRSFSVPDCVQDVLSAIYYARNIDYSKYKPGDKVPFDMFIDEEVHHLYIRYLGKHKITTRYGTFNTLKIRPLLVEGTIFKGGENMDIYVTDDQNLVPVRISSPILVGSIKVDMTSFSGLRYPMKALIRKSK